MTKKDYELIEHWIAFNVKQQLALHNKDGWNALAALTLNLGEAFQSENPKFDIDKFDLACGIKTNWNWSEPKQ